MTDRAVVFIDGSNFCHAMRSIGFSGSDLIELDYRRLALKLAGKDRELREYRATLTWPTYR